MNDDSVLSLKGVTKMFSGLAAVDHVSFDVREGEIYGLIGPNGAGKTTIFNLITGVYALTEGEIDYYGRPIAKAPEGGKKPLLNKPYIIADMGVTRTFQNIRLFKNLSVRDNVLTACHRSASYNLIQPMFRLRVSGRLSQTKFGRALGAFRREEDELNTKSDELLKLMGLQSFQSVMASNLPYGLQRKLEIARALALDPKLLLLDEPAAGMNPEETDQLMNLIRGIRESFNLTMLIIEHHMDLIMGVCDRIFVLNFGRPLALGTPAEVQSNPAVAQAYLGVKEDRKPANKKSTPKERYHEK